MESPGWFASLAHRASYKALKKLENDDNVQFLNRHKLFQDLKPAAFLYLHSHLVERRYKKGETIFKEGNPGMCLFMVKYGKVEIYGECEDDSAERTVYTQVGEGALFGEMSLISMAYRNSSAEATDHGTGLLTLSTYDLDALCDLYPKDGVTVIRSLNRAISNHLLEVDRQLREARREIIQLKKKLSDHE